MFRSHIEKFCFFIQYPNREAYFFVAVSEFSLFFVLNVTKNMRGRVKPFSFPASDRLEIRCGYRRA